MKGIHKKTNGARVRIYTGFSPTYRRYSNSNLSELEIGKFYESKYAKGNQTNKKKRRKK